MHSRLRAVSAVALLVSATALGQAQRPSVVPAPLEFQANPALKKFDEQLKTTFFQSMRDRGGVLMPMKAEVEAAYLAGKRQDCRESNECLTQLATRAGTLYALFAEVGYSEQKVVTVSARVVRDDGKVMGATSVQAEKGKDTIVEVAKRLFIKAFEQLALANLPTFKEAKVEPTKSVEPDVKKQPDVVVKDLPPPPPPPQVIEHRMSGGRVIGLVGVGVGAAAAIVGLAVFATVPPVIDANGNAVSADQFRAVQTQQAAGVGLMAGGGAVALAGAVLAIVSKDTEVVKTTLLPMPGGAVVLVGGNF